MKRNIYRSSLLLGATAMSMMFTPLVLAQDISIATVPPSVESNRFWGTPGDHSMSAAMQGLLGHNAETGIYENNELAESWESNDDLTEWTFHLHPDAEFHFGWGPVTAEDVVHSFALHTGDDSRLSSIYMFDGVEAAAIDAHTVRFSLPAPQAEFPFAHGARGSLKIYSKAQYEAEGLAGYDEQPAGTGRFQYAGRDGSRSLSFDAVENHWSGQDANIDSLTLVFIAEPSTALATLLAKEVDIAVLPRELQAQAQQAGFEILSSTNAANQTSFLFNGTFLTEGDEANGENLPWQDVRFREAVNRAIDRETVLQVAYDGRAEILPVFTMHEANEGYVPELAERFDEYYGYDPERAKAILDEIGYPDSFENPVVPLLVTTHTGSTEFPIIAEVLQVFLEQAGIQTEMVEMDWGSLGQLRGAREAHLLHPMRNLPVKPSEVGITCYFSTQGRPCSAYEHPYIEDRLNALQASSDLDEREQLLGEMFTHIFEEYASVPIAGVGQDFVINPETISEWTIPGVSSRATHHHEIVPAN